MYILHVALLFFAFVQTKGEAENENDRLVEEFKRSVDELLDMSKNDEQQSPAKDEAVMQTTSEVTAKEKDQNVKNEKRDLFDRERMYESSHLFKKNKGTCGGAATITEAQCRTLADADPSKAIHLNYETGAIPNLGVKSSDDLPAGCSTSVVRGDLIAYYYNTKTDSTAKCGKNTCICQQTSCSNPNPSKKQCFESILDSCDGKRIEALRIQIREGRIVEGAPPCTKDSQCCGHMVEKFGQFGNMQEHKPYCNRRYKECGFITTSSLNWFSPNFEFDFGESIEELLELF